MAYTSKSSKLGYSENIITDIKDKFDIDVSQDILESAINTLTEEQHNTLRLYYVEQMTYSQAAQILGITSGMATACINSRITKALDIIAKYARHNGTRSIYAAFAMNNPSKYNALHNALISGGFKSIDDLSGMKYSELLKIHSIGVKQLETIVNRCREYGVPLVADV